MVTKQSLQTGGYSDEGTDTQPIIPEGWRLLTGADAMPKYAGDRGTVNGKYYIAERNPNIPGQFIWREVPIEQVRQEAQYRKALTDKAASDKELRDLQIQRAKKALEPKEPKETTPVFGEKEVDAPDGNGTWIVKTQHGEPLKDEYGNYQQV